MKYTITNLKEASNGIIDEGTDMYPDMLNGGEDFDSLDDLIYWLTSDLGYTKKNGYSGWGEVLRDEKTGEIISVCEK